MRNKKNGPQHWVKPYSTPPKQYGNRHVSQRTVARGFAGGSGSKPNTSPLISFVTDVVSQGTSPRIV